MVNLKYLIIESHFDDAWINCGMYILSKKDCVFDIITLASSKGKNDASETSKLSGIVENVRDHYDLKYEDIQFSRENNKKYANLDLKDVFNTINQNVGSYESMEKYVRQLIVKVDPEFIFCPLGIQHNMHRLTFILAKELNFRNTIFYYDHPYVDKKMNKEEVAKKLKNLGEVKEFKFPIELKKTKIEVFRKVYKSQWFFQSLVREMEVETFVE